MNGMTPHPIRTPGLLITDFIGTCDESEVVSKCRND